VICTSGTAAANFLPAVVEASLDGVPMLLLTADRPAELRDTAANQTIAQPGLYGGYPRWQTDMPAPDRAVPPQALLTTLDQAVYRTGGEVPGPVHLNMPFREPLSGALPDWSDTWLAPVARWQAEVAPLTRYHPPPPAAPLAADDPVVEALRAARRGLVVVGRLPCAREAAAAASIAARLGWPVLADIGAGLRGSVAPARLVRHADLVLRDRAGWAGRAPDCVLHLGGESVSKPLAQFLDAVAPPRLIRAVPDPRRRDPGHQTTDRLVVTLAALDDALAGLVAAPAEPGWLEGWAGAEAAVAGAATAAMEGEALDEPAAARVLGAALPRDWGWFVGSSMPIRDADVFAAETPDHVAANRGASGIDGTLATACGYAAGLGRPVALLCGDLAALHDLNALLLLRQADPPVLAVVINNDGGGIFHFLPVAGEADRFETWFGTPHGVSVAPLARGFGMEAETPATQGALRDAVARFIANPSPMLLEIRTERQANRARHRELETVALTALDAA
jgi:2-succinyl-5-enolpyruvyl-6-hydroxy-3-cyclohexene-1-carboxylate synthase